MKAFLLMVVLVFGVGCDDGGLKRAATFNTGLGTVRSIDWHHRTFVFENDWGTVMSFDRLCYTNIQVWIGFRGTITAHYRNNPPFVNSWCLEIENVAHIPPDVTPITKKTHRV